MYRVTTPTHKFKLPNNAEEYAEIQVAYKQGESVLVKHYQDNVLPEGMTFDGNIVKIRLTQEETKAFAKGIVQAQIRAMNSNGDVFASKMFDVYVNEVIKEDILS